MIPMVFVPPAPPVATFSIAACDARAGDCGVAVASRFFAVGSVVPWAKAGVGAVATQAFANPFYGPKGLTLMEMGFTPEEAIGALTKSDDGREERQVGMASAKGDSFSYTGRKCMSWAGGKTGPGWAAQGNILVSAKVVDAMGEAFEKTPGELAERLIAALEAGEAAGGDSRGKQSAALLVARAGAGYGGSDRYVDLRVDDHPEPFQELRRLFEMHRGMAAGNRALALYRDGKITEAAAEARKAAEATGAPADAIYNAACFSALAGLKGDALAYLEKSLRMDPKLRALALQDPDLVSLRDEPRFQKAVGGK